MLKYKVRITDADGWRQRPAGWLTIGSNDDGGLEFRRADSVSDATIFFSMEQARFEVNQVKLILKETRRERWNFKVLRTDDEGRVPGHFPR